MGTDRSRAAAALALAGLWLALGCASPLAVPVEPPTGSVFSRYWAPLDTNFDATPVGSKVGTAVLHHIELPLYYVAARIPLGTWLDLGVRKAAEGAGIRTVHYADYQLMDVLGVYIRITVRVSGD